MNPSYGEVRSLQAVQPLKSSAACRDSGDRRRAVRLTWQVTRWQATLTQLAYEIQTSRTADFAELLATSGEMRGEDQVAVAAPGAATEEPRDSSLRVRIATEAGWTDWSPVLKVEAGLLEASDWVAEAVTLPDDPGSAAPVAVAVASA